MQNKNQTAQEIINITEKLYSMMSVEEGIKYLELNCKRKSDLVSLANYIGDYFKIRDNIPNLRDAIVESTIGYRVRSASIQGNPIEPYHNSKT